MPGNDAARPSPSDVRSAEATVSPWVSARALALSGRLKVQWHAALDADPPPLPSSIDLANRVEGMLLGLAIGDALGNTSESLNPDERSARHGWICHYLPNSHAGGRAVGLPSDDTQLAFWTLEQIVVDGRLNPERLGELFCARPIYGIGQTLRRFRQNRLQGLPWDRCAVASAGNGALMRIAPLLVPYVASPSRDLWADTLLAAQLTHDDLLSNSSCVALASLLWQMLGTEAPTDANGLLDAWLAVSEPLAAGRPDGQFVPRAGRPPGFRGTVADLVRDHVLPALAQGLDVAQACALWHSGAYLLETVPSVLYVLARHGHDPREAVLQAVNNTRDNDTCAAVVGAVVGALHGARAWPDAWLRALPGRTRSDDDGHVFRLLQTSGDRFGYGVSPAVRRQAARRRG